MAVLLECSSSGIRHSAFTWVLSPLPWSVWLGTNTCASGSLLRIAHCDLTHSCEAFCETQRGMYCVSLLKYPSVQFWHCNRRLGKEKALNVLMLNALRSWGNSSVPVYKVQRYIASHANDVSAGCVWDCYYPVQHEKITKRLVFFSATLCGCVGY